MENQTLVVLDGNQVSVESLRIGVAEAVKRAYGAERAYAKGLNQIFSFDWFMFEANDISDDAKTVKVEKTLLYTALKAAEHTNPSTVWARIRKYGAEDRHGKTEGEGAEGEGAEGAEGEGSAQRDVTTRNVEELIKLYKFNSKQDSLPAKVREANDAIVMALKCLGVDVSMVK
jgi:hypothetical protein